MTLDIARPPAPTRWDSDLVVAAFEAAVATLRALPMTGHSGRLATLRLITLPDEHPGAPADSEPWRPRPSAAAIDRMDCVLSWLSFLPSDRLILRKLVSLRAQTSVTGRAMSWRKIADQLHTDKLACQRWHAQAISILVRELRARRIPLPHPDR